MAWTALAPSAGLSLVPGAFYAVVASVKASHTQADLEAFAARRGLRLVDYAEQGDRAGLGPDPRSPDYRYVAAIAQASLGGSIPGSVPWPASIFDSSALVAAWSAPPGTIAPAAPPIPPAPPPVRSALPVPFGPAVDWWKLR